MIGDRIGDDLVDTALEQTFPASDPPSFMAIGAPRPSDPRLSRTWSESNRVLPSSPESRRGTSRS
jgi:hypothetical protein